MSTKTKKENRNIIGGLFIRYQVTNRGKRECFAVFPLWQYGTSGESIAKFNTWDEAREFCIRQK